MTDWVILGLALIIMVRVAIIEQRSPLLWGLITLGLCFSGMALIPYPIFGVAAGLVASFLAMFALNVLKTT